MTRVSCLLVLFLLQLAIADDDPDGFDPVLARTPPKPWRFFRNVTHCRVSVDLTARTMTMPPPHKREHARCVFLSLDIPGYALPRLPTAGNKLALVTSIKEPSTPIKWDLAKADSYNSILPMLLSKFSYAYFNQYPFYVFNSAVWWDLPGRVHHKICYVKYYLVKYLFSLGFEDVMWVDADAFTPNYHVTVDTLRDLHFEGKKASFMGQDALWLNAGVFAMRDTPFTAELLQILWMDAQLDFNPVYGLSDQLALQHSLVKLVDRKHNGGKLRGKFELPDYCVGLDRAAKPNKCWVQMVHYGPLKRVMRRIPHEVQLLPWASGVSPGASCVSNFDLTKPCKPDKAAILQCANIHSRYFSRKHCMGPVKPIAIHIGGHAHTTKALTPWKHLIDDVFEHLGDSPRCRTDWPPCEWHSSGRDDEKGVSLTAD